MLTNQTAVCHLRYYSAATTPQPVAVKCGIVRACTQRDVDVNCIASHVHITCSFH